MAGSIFTFSLTLGDYITPDLVADAKFIGNVIYDNSSLGNLPVAAAYSLVPIAIMTVYLLVASDRAPSSRCEAHDDESGVARILLRLATAAVLTFLYLPLVIIAIYAFNEPHPGVAAEWLDAPLVRRGDGRPAGHPGARQLDHRGHDRDRDRPGPGHARIIGGPALRLFGRETISFFLVLPIALPGVVTGIALRTSFVTFGVEFAPDDRHRPRDFLCRHRLQQRHRPAPTPAPLTGGSVRRPRRRRVRRFDE